MVTLIFQLKHGENGRVGKNKIRSFFRDLVNSKGIVLDPEIEEDPNPDARYEPDNVADYFDNDFKIDSDEEIDEDDDDAEDRTSFEFRAKKMVNLTEDGGVKKKVCLLP